MPLRPSFDVALFNQLGAGSLPGHLGMMVTAVAEGRLELELPIAPFLLAPNGYLHAGAVVSLADTTAGFACLAHLPDGAQNFTTIELKTNFLGTAREGTLRCEAKSVHLGRTTQVWDATVTAPDRAAQPRTIALFRCTQLVLYPK